MVSTTSPAEQIAALRIAVCSPDRSVTARITPESGLAVDFDVDRLHRHDDDSLSRQLTTAVKDAQAEFGAAFDAVLDELRDREPSSASPPTPGPGSASGQRVRDAARKVVTSGTSRRGRVRARVAGDGRIKIVLTPGTVAYLRGETDELAGEVAEAVRGAQHDYSAAVAEIRRSRTDRASGNDEGRS